MIDLTYNTVGKRVRLSRIIGRGRSVNICIRPRRGTRPQRLYSRDIER